MPELPPAPSNQQPQQPQLGQSGEVQISWQTQNRTRAAQAPGPPRAYKLSPPTTEHAAPAEEVADIPTVEGDLMDGDQVVVTAAETKKLFDEDERQQSPRHIDIPA